MITPHLPSVRKCLAATACGILLAAASVTVNATPDTVITTPVGPRPPGEYDGSKEGYLIVYSACETNYNGDMCYFPHTAYDIFQGGKRVMTVNNRFNNQDETPEKASLAPGRYTVIAESEKDGEVSVPVIIETAHTTVLHLERGYASEQTKVNPAKAAKLPSGQVIGWASNK